MGSKLKNRKTICAIASCPSPSGISYHTFPKDKKLHDIWLSACKRKDIVNTKTASICANHFRQEDFDRDFRNELLNLPVRSLLKKGILSKECRILIKLFCGKYSKLN